LAERASPGRGAAAASAVSPGARCPSPVNDASLYRGTHQTFEAYLRDRWGISRSRDYQLQEAPVMVGPPSRDVDTLVLGTELQAGELLARLRLLLSQSSGAIANVVLHVETRAVDLDDGAREQLREDILVLDEEFATLTALLVAPVDWDAEHERLLAGEIPPFEDDRDDDENE
jgi:hypothetical protein